MGGCEIARRLIPDGRPPFLARSADREARLEAPNHALVEEWQQLVRDLGAAPFLGPGWVLTWARAFSRVPVDVLCIRRDGRLDGLLPLVERWGIRASPTNWHTPQFGFLARDAETRSLLAAALLETSSTAVDLCFLDREDAAVGTLIAAADRPRARVVVRTVQRAPYVDLTAGDWESFRTTVDAKVRKELRRTRRRLEERGTVEVVFLTDAGRLADGFRLEGSGWKAWRNTAIASDPRTETFYREIAAWAELQGELVLAFLQVDGRPIAFDLCLESAGHVYALKGGFDPSFRKYGPGMLLTYESIRRAFERGHLSYDLLGDSERYKLVWTQTARERVRIQVFNVGSVAGAVSWAAWAYGQPAARRLRAAARRPS